MPIRDERPDVPAGEELKIGRLLCGLSAEAMAARLVVSRLTVIAIEAGKSARARTVLEYHRLLTAWGVVFVAPGLVTHATRGRAPTRAAVGVLTGERFARMREGTRLNRDQLHLALEIPLATIMKIEGLARPLERGMHDIQVYQVFNAYERIGCHFGKSAGGDKAVKLDLRQGLRAALDQVRQGAQGVRQPAT